MRKWIALILTTLLLLAAMGAAADTDKPQTGIAVAAPADEVSTVAMHEMPDPDSAVLMEYYQGAVFDVLSLEKSGMVRVQIDKTVGWNLLKASIPRFCGFGGDLRGRFVLRGKKKMGGGQGGDAAEQLAGYHRW